MWRGWGVHRGVATICLRSWSPRFPVPAVSESHDSRRLRWGVLWALVVRLSFVFTAAAIDLSAAALVSDDATESTSTIDRLRDASLLEAPETVLRGLVGNPVAFVAWVAVAGGSVQSLAVTAAPDGSSPSVPGSSTSPRSWRWSRGCWLLVRMTTCPACSAHSCRGRDRLLVGRVVALLAGVYLLVTDRWALHSDIVFAVQGRTEFKSFVRLRVLRSGDLDVYVYGIPEIVKMWRRNDSTDRANRCWSPPQRYTRRMQDEWSRRSSS